MKTYGRITRIHSERKSEDWDIVVAGQRVQVIKDTDAGGKGTLQFGTEVVSAADGSIAALLGASPGASTAVHVMLEVLEKCFKPNGRMGRKNKRNDSFLRHFINRKSKIIPRPSHFYRSYPWIK